MDRREAILRELNLYPQWELRGQPASVAQEEPAPISNAAEAIVSTVIDTSTPLSPSLSDGNASHSAGETTSQSIKPPKNVGQVAGYRPSAEELLAGHPKDDSRTINYPTSGRAEFSNLSWTELKQTVRDCTACKLRAGCTQTVFGVGDEKADWLFVGEGPGADEDAQGEPFVGQAGKLLDSMLAAIKLKRGKNVYIANIVKCRPPDNRAPAAAEIAQCLPYLKRQITLLQPKLIVALGKTAATALLGKEATLGSLRGTLHDYHGIPLIVTYHPAYLLRSPTEKAKAWQDLCFAVETMQKA